MTQSDLPSIRPHIFLVGFMACGKSTVGPVLAARLQRPFIDLDDSIQAEVGCSIADLIAREGEERFRQIETQKLREVAQGSRRVIAPGGGAITRAVNRELMSQSGLTVWLDAPFDLCWRRIRQDGATRPLAPDENAARARYEQRLPLYRQSAIQVSVHETMSPDDISEMIFQKSSEFRLQAAPENEREPPEGGTPNFI